MDVVPIEEGWDMDPFAGVIKDGRIYGRGASDMKGSIASLLMALEVMQELGLKSKFDINCTLCTDEEIGVYPGVYYLARKGFVPNGPVICMEGMQEPLDWLASAGCLEVSIKVKGRSCHSGMNFMGVNAVEESVPILNELMALKRVVEKRESSIPGAKMPNAPSDKMTPMFNIDIINGGVKSNIVPSECEIILNRRYIPEENYDDVVKEIREAVERGKAKSKALAVETMFTRVYPAIKVNPNTAYALKMKEAVKKVQGYKDSDFVAMGLSGSTDMAFVQMVTHNENIIFRGTGRNDSNFHGKNEFCYLKDLKALAKELIYFLTE
jgi:succinyl-diaminopimelate desuccinylase